MSRILAIALIGVMCSNLLILPTSSVAEQSSSAFQRSLSTGVVRSKALSNRIRETKVRRNFRLQNQQQQSSFATIVGLVVDRTQIPVRRATVATNKPGVVGATDGNGILIVRNIPVSGSEEVITLIVKAIEGSSPMFDNFAIRDVTVRPGETTRIVDIVMSDIFPKMSVANAASFEKSISPSSIAAITIAEVSDNTRTENASGSSLPLQLAGRRILVNGTPTGLFFSSPRQVNASIPALSPGRNEFLVEINGKVRSGQMVTALPTAPGVFTVLSNGTGAASALNFNPLEGLYRSNHLEPLIRDNREGVPDNVLILYTTGLGLLRNVPVKPLVFLNNDRSFPLNVLYAGEAPGFIGLDQINLVIPKSYPFVRGTVRIQVCDPTGVICSRFDPTVNIRTVP